MGLWLGRCIALGYNIAFPQMQLYVESSGDKMGGQMCWENICQKKKDVYFRFPTHSIMAHPYFLYITSDNTPISHVNKTVLFRLMIMMMVASFIFLYVCALNGSLCFYSV